MRIRILLADSHTVSLVTLSRFLQDREDIEVVGQAKDGHTAVELTRQLIPDIVIMDADTAILPGVDAVRQIHRDQPGVRILIMSVDPVPPRVREAFKAGASGYLLKDCDPETLLTALRTVSDGGMYVSPDVHGRPQDDPKQGT
jgi:DNA-binding NarL/FixJ family response regulator